MQGTGPEYSYRPGQGQSYLEISTVKRGTVIYREYLSAEFTENVAAAMNPVKLKHQRIHSHTRAHTHTHTHTHPPSPNPIARFPWQPEQLLDGRVFVATLLQKDSGEGFHRRICYFGFSQKCMLRQGFVVFLADDPWKYQ